MIRCPFCLGIIQKGAYICRHCNRELIPEYIFLYRNVLEKYPEYRDNSKESKEKLEIALKNQYERYLVQQKIKKLEEEKKRLDMLEQEKNYRDEQKRLRKETIEKIRKRLRLPIYKFFLLPTLLVSIVISGYVVTTDEFARWRYLNTGGEIINVDKFIKKNLGTINLRNLGDGFQLHSNNSTILCEIWLKADQRSNFCGKSIRYINDKEVEVSVWYEIYMCQDRKRVRALTATVFMVSDQTVEGQELIRSQNDDFVVGYGCDVATN